MPLLLKRNHAILSVLLLLAACGETGNNNNTGAKGDREFSASLTEKQIGESKFSISLPPGFVLKEKEGEDFSVYYFQPADTSATNTFAGGLYFGNHPGKFEPENDSCKTETLKSMLLGENADWTVTDCNGTYSIQALADSKSGEGWNAYIHAFGTAWSMEDRARLFTVYSTVKKKS